MTALPAVVGVVLAVAVAIFARLVGFDRDRAFYPVVLVVVASYYDLFAIMGGGDALIAELVGSGLFVAAAAIGFRTSLWIVVAGLAGHGVFDLIHATVIHNPGVPAWWPLWCLAYDIAAAACLAALIFKGAVSALATRFA